MGNGIASGTRRGPAAIRTASLAFDPGVRGIDHGDVGQVCGRDWEHVLIDVEAKAADIIARGSRPITLGGDHAVSYAAIAGTRMSQPLNIIWFDAHTDFCTWPQSAWHNHKQVLRRISGLDHVGRIVQIGHRGITYFDEAQRFDRITVVTAADAEREPLSGILNALPVGEPVYISIDIDVLDPRWAPGTGHPVPGGLSVPLLIDLAGKIADHRNVVALDLMEVNPLLDHEHMTSMAAAKVLASLVSKLGNRSDDVTPRRSAAAAGT